ncbi:hypothetical protein Tsubulata_009421 [Turnera subulata]|uniref:Uncharacterized protein n=1 Tax=Turnera subulata TaxID=218843 RepID=A0A9Q0G473_9ROSI|nr:hypothetical protein Tsubulata_009421 [Turnera subulata]
MAVSDRRFRERKEGGGGGGEEGGEEELESLRISSRVRWGDESSGSGRSDGERFGGRGHPGRAVGAFDNIGGAKFQRSRRIKTGFMENETEANLEEMMKKNGWWTKSNWAFLKEPPVLECSSKFQHLRFTVSHCQSFQVKGKPWHYYLLIK